MSNRAMLTAVSSLVILCLFAAFLALGIVIGSRLQIETVPRQIETLEMEHPPKLLDMPEVHTTRTI